MVQNEKMLLHFSPTKAKKVNFPSNKMQNRWVFVGILSQIKKASNPGNFILLFFASNPPSEGDRHPCDGGQWEDEEDDEVQEDGEATLLE